ncbi:MAG: AraC family transcriptional regulator [Bacteroidota bacterium]
MQANFFLPSPPLKDFVAYYTFLGREGIGPETKAVTGYPSGYADLVWVLGKGPKVKIEGQAFQEMQGLNLVGHFDQPFSVDLSSIDTVLWVRMKPHGLHALTGLPAKNFHNKWVHADRVGLPSIRPALYTRYDSKNGRALISKLEAYLVKHITRHFSPDARLSYVVRLLEDPKCPVRLKKLSETLGCSYRSLDRLFWQKIGQSPKRVVSNLRFKSLLAEVQNREDLDWMQLVVDFGFHDQAHLIKEFQKYTALSPQRFMRSRQSIGFGLYA